MALWWCNSIVFLSYLCTLWCTQSQSAPLSSLPDEHQSLENVKLNVDLSFMLLGRCHEYQSIIMPQPFYDNPKNCTLLVEMLTSALIIAREQMLHSCQVNSEPYEDVVQYGDHIIPEGQKFMLWSGVDYRMLQYTVENGVRYFTIRSILIGHMLHDVSLCQALEPPIRNSECSCWIAEYEPAFWKEVSRKFAAKMNGHVSIALNGTKTNNRPAYDPQSILALNEMPIVLSKTSQITGFSILLSRDIQSPVLGESCSSTSIQKLQQLIKSHNFPVECEYNPRLFRHELCQDSENIDLPECQFRSSSSQLCSQSRLLLLLGWICFHIIS